MNLSFNVGDDPVFVKENRSAFFGVLGIGTDRLAFMQQVHGSVVKVVEEPGIYPSCDGMVTNMRGIYLCVTVADCVPVFILDRGAHALAVVHAGWRGTAARIVVEAVGMLQTRFGARASAMEAFIGPAAGACCYEVGDEVAAAFSGQFSSGSAGKFHLDLKEANRAQLMAAGVPRASVELHPGCTIHESSQYHSFRRDGRQSGRMIGVAGLV
jgi:polyphenol oxidase